MSYEVVVNGRTMAADAIIGREILILSGSDEDGYFGGWDDDEMGHLVGNTYEVDRVRINGSRFGYFIIDENGIDWLIDSRYCVFEDDEQIRRATAEIQCDNIDGLF